MQASFDLADEFLRQAQRRPQHPAVVVDEVCLSYEALARQVLRLAAHFSRRTDPRILVALPQVPDAYAAIIASSLAGGYYTPLNLAAPTAKLRRIARLLQPDFIVGHGAIIADLADEAPAAEILDPARLSVVEPAHDLTRRHRLAYVTFTSGSTGMPKGVMVSRQAINTYAQWVNRSFGITPADRVSQHPNLAFDISMTDIIGAFCGGATLYPLLDEADRLMPARMIEREKITVWNSVPSVVSLMMQARHVTERNLGSVRLFNFCGEPLLPEHLSALFAARPDAVVQNTYGPTEATVAVTALQLRADSWQAHTRTSVALGEALPAMRLDLVGGRHPDEGQIVISGPQLAEGYWQEPAMSRRAFRPLQIAGHGLVHGYSTGDWAERHDGQVYFRERLDFQVKIRGFRVELDEVAAAIRDCGWPIACVVARQDALAAVVEAVPGKEFDEAGLRRALARRVESYAIPLNIREIERMPRNENDKLDRKAVTDWLEQEHAALDTSPPNHRNEVEA